MTFVHETPAAKLKSGAEGLSEFMREVGGNLLTPSAGGSLVGGAGDDPNDPRRSRHGMGTVVCRQEKLISRRQDRVLLQSASRMDRETVVLFPSEGAHLVVVISGANTKVLPPGSRSMWRPQTSLPCP